MKFLKTGDTIVSLANIKSIKVCKIKCYNTDTKIGYMGYQIKCFSQDEDDHIDYPGGGVELTTLKPLTEVNPEIYLNQLMKMISTVPDYTTISCMNEKTQEWELEVL